MMRPSSSLGLQPGIWLLIAVSACTQYRVATHDGGDASETDGGFGPDGAARGSGGSGAGGARDADAHDASIDTPGTAGAIGSGGMTGGGGGVTGSGGAGIGGTAGTGAGGTAGVGATGGSIGGVGGGGGHACTDTSSDAANCGTCGHSCLGGQCSAGVCQPLLLATVPSTTEYAHQTVVSGGKVYVFTGDGTNAPSSIWQTDASTPGTPTEVATNGTVSCVMNGQLFWITDNQGTYGIASCTISNCPATTAPVMTFTTAGTFFGIGPGCDPVNHELVWASTMDFATFTISRASPDGSNMRPVTSLYLVDNTYHFVGNGMFQGATDRIFYRHTDFTAGTDTLYYVSTSIANATSVQIALVNNISIAPGIQPPLEPATSTIFLASEYTSSTFTTLKVPLPNGIPSGTPAVFAHGYVYDGVLDATDFYGAIRGDSSIPTNSVIRCPLSSDCSAPIVIAQGQNGTNFADDGSAIYWTTTGLASNVAIWKIAK